MKQGLSHLILIIISMSTIIMAQPSQYGVNEKSYYSKVIRLGSAYTGYAKGIESINTNTAGLADMDQVSVIYSDGYGGPILGPKNPSYSLSLVAPTQFHDIVVGASYNRLSLDLGKNTKWINSKFAVHAAKKISADFSAGLSLNYFRLDTRWMISTIEDPVPHRGMEFNSHAFDISLGLFYKINDPFGLKVPNRLGFGAYFENVLATKESINIPDELKGQVKPEHKYQQIRLGTSYEITSSEMKFHDLNFVKMLFVFDAVFNTRNYEFLTWQPNYGIEITFLDVLSLSMGRENQIKIDDSIYGSTDAYPVSRYGIGIQLPLQKMFNLTRSINAEINYYYSDWQKIDKNFLFNQPIDRRGLSIALSWQI